VSEPWWLWRLRQLATLEDERPPRLVQVQLRDLKDLLAAFDRASVSLSVRSLARPVAELSPSKGRVR